MKDAIRSLIDYCNERRRTANSWGVASLAEHVARELESALAAESPTTIETCHRCSAQVPFRDQGQRFCHGCGAELSDPSVECSRCDWRGKRQGLREENGTQLCPQCDRVVRAESPDPVQIRETDLWAKINALAEEVLASHSKPDPERQARERLGMWLVADLGKRSAHVDDPSPFAACFHAQLFDSIRHRIESFEADGDTWAEAVNAALDRAEGK